MSPCCFPRPALVAAGFLAVASDHGLPSFLLPGSREGWQIRAAWFEAFRPQGPARSDPCAQVAGVARRYSALSFCRGFPHFRFPLSLGYSSQAPR